MEDQRFRREDRLRRKAEFERVYAARQTAADENLLVFGCENGLAHPRLGSIGFAEGRHGSEAEPLEAAPA